MIESVACVLSPPSWKGKVMLNIVLVCSVAVLYGIYYVSIKGGSEGIHEVVGAVILQVVAATIGSGALLFLYLRGTTFPRITSKGLGFAVVAGVAVGIAEILSFYVYSRGLTAAKCAPLIVGGSALVGSLLGVALLHEALRPCQYAGLALMVIAIVLLTAE